MAVAVLLAMAVWVARRPRAIGFSVEVAVEAAVARATTGVGLRVGGVLVAVGKGLGSAVGVQTAASAVWVIA
jgi:hypothetical protein